APYGTAASENLSAEKFIGRWSLYLPGGAGWLELRQEQGYLDADLLWYGGSVEPVAGVFMDGDKLVVTRLNEVIRKKDEDGNALRKHTMTSWYEFSASGDDLKGIARIPGGQRQSIDVVEFAGKRIPPLPPPPDLSQVKYGEPIELFNGRNLDGWELTNPNSENGFTVVDGVLVNDPVQEEGKPHKHYGNLRTVQEFEDFHLKAQVNVPKGSNSGIYLRGIYEVQVLDSYGQAVDSHNMGAIYSRITPTVAAEKPAGQWQELDITLCDRHVAVVLNGVKIIDNRPLFGVTGGALSADEFAPGPIYFQGDHGKVLYRNIVLTPIMK
ncbi:glycosyl hydrolase, partial [candidate division KSB1 bacterium RBG_16_48_16]